MANLNGFNANEVEPNVGFEPLPAGDYVAAITGSQMKPTKNGAGSFLELEFTVLEGEYRDRKIWDRLCLNHPNAQAVQIARGNLSALCRAVGIMQPGDSVELHNLPLSIKVACKKREDNGEISNEIKGYKKKGQNGAPSPSPGQADNTPPWRK